MSLKSSIDPFIHRKVVVLEATSSAYVAARAMCEHDIGSVVVSDNMGHIVGIVTDRNLACDLLAARLVPETSLSQIMSKNPVVIDESASIEEAVVLMKQNGIRRVPVVKMTHKGKQKCVGMISLDDVLANQAIDISEVAAVVRSQIIRRKKTRSTVEDTRAAQALEIFVEAVRYNVNLEKAEAMRFIDLVFGLLVSRLHATGAAHLILELPTPLQRKLLELPSGPDRNITAKQILDRLIGAFFYDEQQARNKLAEFWKVVTRGIGQDNADHILHQLPKDIQLLLRSPAEIVGQVQGAS